MQTKKRLARKTGLAKKRETPRIVRDRAPKPKAEAILYPDGQGGREICNQKCAAGKREYGWRTLEMVRRQDNRCAWCGGWMPESRATFDHEDGRTAGHKDERLWRADGTPQNAALHRVCNGLRGSTRAPYPFQTTVTRSEWEATR